MALPWPIPEQCGNPKTNHRTTPEHFFGDVFCFHDCVEIDAWYDMIRFVLVRNSLRHIRVIALTASNDERCVVRSRLKHQLSQLSLSLHKNSKFCSRTGFISAFSKFVSNLRESWEKSRSSVQRSAPAPPWTATINSSPGPHRAVAGFTAAAGCGPGWVNGMLDTLKKTSPEMWKGMQITGMINKTETRKSCRKCYKMVSRIEAMGGPEAHLFQKMRSNSCRAKNVARCPCKKQTKRVQRWMTASNDESCVVRSRFKHQLSQLPLSLRNTQNFWTVCAGFQKAEINFRSSVQRSAPAPPWTATINYTSPGPHRAVTGFTAAAGCGPGWVNGMLDTLKKTSPEMWKGMQITGTINKTGTRKSCRKCYKMVSRIEAMGGRAHLEENAQQLMSSKKCGKMPLQKTCAKMNERRKKSEAMCFHWWIQERP